MSNRCKVSVKTIFAGSAISLFTLLTLQISASHKSSRFFLNPLTQISDTTPVPIGGRFRDSITPTGPRKPADTTRRSKDTTVVTEFSLDSVKISKDSLDAPIRYAASDSGVLIIPTKQFFLYNKASTEYKDLQLDAGVIRFDQSTQVVMAYGVKDSLNPYAKATLKQGGSTSTSDTIFYNMKSQKGLTKNTFYQDENSEFFVQTERMKKLTEGGDNIVFAYRNQFTTCNLDTPHFAFRTKKMKIITNKLAVSGPAHPEFEGVPVPIYLPFGIYPMKQGRHSGILAPQFAANEEFGLGLEGLGYYKVLGEHVDVTVRTNLYSYGGWNLFITPKYTRRYRYAGGLNLSIQHTRRLNTIPSAKEEFFTGNAFNISWNHMRDGKARPGTSFSANVNAGSTQYNRNVPNNAHINFTNTLTSSVQWGKTTPRMNLSVAANHTQNNNTREVNLSLPSMTLSLLTLYPFQNKNRVGSEKWYEKLGLSYNGTLENRVSFYDSAFKFNNILDTLQWAINHNIPISLALPSLGPVNLTPTINFSERWLGRSVTYTWDPVLQKIDTVFAKGFFTPREVSTGISASTRVFGLYGFGKNSNVQAIRHEIRPSFGFSYKPDLAKKYFDSVQVDTGGGKIAYSKLQAGTFGGAFGSGKFGGITFSVDNVLEMKVKDRKGQPDSAGKYPDKKIRLIDGFGFNGGYNLAVDSFQWSQLNFYLRSTLFEKINITANAMLDPYITNDQGFVTKELAWTSRNNRGFGTVRTASIAASANFQSKKADEKKQQAPSDQYVTPDEQQRLLDYVRNNPAEFTDFNIPWTLQTSFSLSFTRLFDFNQKKWTTTTTTNISLNGDFSLSPKWKIGGQTYFDITTKKFQYLTFFVTRDMHCWQMAINIVPVGLYRSFNITLNPKSGLLRDLRINRSRFFYAQ
ncbi:MAG: LPS-assembly protein LptD [Chitinophagaceae bacterium]|nr:LPS-assembly protein LptD [Chitinophagaceae bacterium]